MKLHTIENIWLLLGLLPLIGLFAYADYARRKALMNFADNRMLQMLSTTVSNVRRWWKAGLVMAAFGFLSFAATRPQWNQKEGLVKRKGRDVVFILDVSRSMLADDLKPSRLRRARIAIQDCLDVLKGDRVGLVVFAGSSVVRCPLTVDYGFFSMMLEDVSPKSVTRGGTMIGDALRKTVSEVFDDQAGKYRDIVLITDGEDHESFPVEAAAAAGKKGIRLIAIGIGDEKQGRRIPITRKDGRKGFLRDKSGEHWSKLDADTLREMTKATPGGRYLNVSTGTIDLGAVYQRLIDSAQKKELESKTLKRYEEKFQIFAAVAFFLLVLELGLSERIRRVAAEQDYET